VSETDCGAPAELSLAEKAKAFHGTMEALNTRDLDGMFSLLTTDILLRTDPGWPGGGEFHGREEITRFAMDFIDPWDDVRYETAEEAASVGGRLVKRGRWSATGHASGIHGTIEFTSVLSFDGPLITRMSVFLDHDEALAFASDTG
jgi:hypothetical protein